MSSVSLLLAETKLYLTPAVFLFGACWGSFLNVCIYRIPFDQSVAVPARSFCPSCERTIAWFDNIPILSYLLLRGKCRHCRERISPRYPLVELITALLFSAIWLLYGPDPRVPVYWLITCGLIAGTFIDFEHLIIPDRFTIGGMAAGLVISPLVPSLHGTASPLHAFLASALGLIVGYGMLKGVAVLGKWAFKKDAMGMGDVKLLGAMGAFLGWDAVIFVVMISSLFGSMVGILLIVSGQKGWQSKIPFGPYLSLAAMIWILGGYRLWAWYYNLFQYEAW